MCGGQLVGRGVPSGHSGKRANEPSAVEGTVESTVPVKEGDLAYYVPWGNLAIFVEDGTGSYTGDLMRLGAVVTGLTALQRPGPLQVRIERMPD